MFVKVHRPVDTPGVCDNKGICQKLIDYLSKEGKDDRDYYDNFFSHTDEFVSSKEVKRKLDNNHRTLKKKDDKFYMLSINPSKEELKHLIRVKTGKNVDQFEDLSSVEKEEVIHELKEYARRSMDLYARNFRREYIKDGNNLLYYGRVETERFYKNTDEEVRNRRKKTGDKKEGLQLHVHIVVSRMDASQKYSLSPLTKSRGNVQMLNGKKIITGFERSEWYGQCNDLFIERYNYKAVYKYEDGNKIKDLRYMPGYNQAMSEMKSQILQKEFQEERKILNYSMRAIRFVINPKQALISELKHALTGGFLNNK